MKWTANEIVNQALNLANLGSTDFLTYREKIDYLNSSFSSLYDLAINKDDLYWLKTCKTIGSSHDTYTDYYLPSDFYKMRCVKSKDGTILVRKSASENKVGYEIVNGYLRVYGYHSELILEYWPQPMFITYKAPKKYIDLGSFPKMAYDDLVIFENNNGMFLNTNYSFNMIKDGELRLVGHNQVLIDNTLYIFVNNEWTDVGEFEGIPILSYDGNIYFYNDGKITSFNGALISDEFAIGNATSNGLLNKERNMLVIAEDNKLKIYGRPFPDDIDVNESLIRRAEWEHYDAFIIGNRIYYWTFEGLHYEITDIDSATNPVLLKADKESGYGFIGFDGSFYLEGWMPETLFDYPNNLFYRAIAADLAFAFLSKQGSDMSSITAVMQEYTSEFLKSIDSNDAYQRIKNVYV